MNKQISGYYVMAPDGDNWVQLDKEVKRYETAKKYRDCEAVKTKHPNAQIFAIFTEEEPKENQHGLIKWLLKNCPRVQKMKQPLTNEEAERLVDEFTRESLIEIFESMDNKADLLKKYMSANKTCRSWIRHRQTTNPNYGKQKKPYIPTA